MPQTFKRLFLKLVVYDNRIEVVEGMFPFKKKQTIPLKNIANVEVSKFTKQLIIDTNDGKKHKFAIGGFGKAQTARQLIAEKL
jgi:hypothetical protein